VFNSGEKWADKIMPYWNGTDYVNKDGSIFDVPAALDRDLTFCSLLDISGEPVDVDIANGVYTGALYLRCDAGNPAEVFSEVAVPQVPTGFYQFSDSTIDGLDLRYFTCTAATLDAYDGYSGMTLKNSEVSWCGGLLHNYGENGALPEGVRKPYGAGGAIQSSGIDITVSGNYIHDCGPMTIIVTVHGDQPRMYRFENQLITGNLMERCGAGLHWADLARMDNAQAEGFISNLEFSNNMVMYSGTGWVNGMIAQIDGTKSLFVSAIEDLMGASNNDGIYIRNNVFYLSGQALLKYTDLMGDSDQAANARPVFSGNTYAQYENGWLAEWNGDLKPITEAVIRDILGDTTGTVVVVN
jgi:hypothetical protein